MVNAQASSCPGEWHTKTPMGFWHIDGSPYLGQKTRPYNNQKKKKKEFAKLSTLLYRLTTELNEKNVKRMINTSTLQENWKNYKHEDDNYTNCDWCFWYSNKSIIKGTGGLGRWRLSGDYLNNNIIENCQNTEKCSGDLRRLAATQIPVKQHQFTLLWKTLMSE